MKINLDNYAEYFIDYLEGKLPDGDMQEFMQFLSKNPLLRNELDDYVEFNLEPKFVEFEDKALLKKTETTDSADNEAFENLCVAKIEDEITAKELRTLEDLLKNKTHNETFRMFTKTKIEADKSIVCDFKTELKKHKTITPLSLRKNFEYVLAIAAMLVFFFFLFRQEKKPTKAPYFIAETKYDLSQNPQKTYPTDNKNFTKTKAQEGIILAHTKIKAKKTTSVRDNYVKYTNTRKEEKEILEKISTLTPKNIFQLEYDNFQNPSIEECCLLNIGTTKRPKNFATQDEDEFLSLRDFIKIKIREKFIGNAQKHKHRKIHFIDIASLSLKKLGKITEKKMELSGKYDQYGNLESFSFRGERFYVGRKKN